MPVSLPCPECERSLQPIFVELPRRRAVELDRCATCGGVWFDFGELQDVTLVRPTLAPFDDAHTTRRCPRCRLVLSPRFLEGSAPVEVCTGCRGLWLDEDDVAALQHARLNALMLKPPEAPSSHEADGPAVRLGFDCAACHSRTPWTEAHGTSKGLVCGRCAPNVQPIPNAPALERTLTEVAVEALLGFWRW
jgi:Zn-finger nucleic acid-binding protein